ncbi:Plasmodium vivax Vir protein, putative [Plasmodium vivax]|nr:Plasmodium vivax Vir protein, putative [Plasmodium vivax]
MSKNITDIANWNEEYPFLKDVWNFYNKFDIITEQDTYDRKIHSSCYMILSEIDKYIEPYNSFCTKLLKNLGHYSKNQESFIRSHYRCNILYNWIYNSKKKHNISDEIINKFFDDYITISGVMKYGDACSYNLHNSFYEEPMKMTILDIFNNNMQNIINKLMGEHEKDKRSAQNFVCECVNLYKEIAKDHCTKITKMNYKREKTCEMLDSFKTSYMQFFYNTIVKNDNIPSLENVEEEYMSKCKNNQPITALASTDGDSAPQFARSTTTVRGNSDASRTTEGINEGDRANSLSPTVSTALGTVAGASSLLALLYKFTPAKRLVHPGFGGNRRRINSNFYAEGPSELLFDGAEHSDFNSYNIGYEAI